MDFGEESSPSRQRAARSAGIAVLCTPKTARLDGTDDSRIGSHLRTASSEQPSQAPIGLPGTGDPRLKWNALGRQIRACPDIHTCGRPGLRVSCSGGSSRNEPPRACTPGRSWICARSARPRRRRRSERLRRLEPAWRPAYERPGPLMFLRRGLHHRGWSRWPCCGRTWLHASPSGHRACSSLVGCSFPRDLANRRTHRMAEEVQEDGPTACASTSVLLLGETSVRPRGHHGHLCRE